MTWYSRSRTLYIPIYKGDRSEIYGSVGGRCGCKEGKVTRCSIAVHETDYTRTTCTATTVIFVYYYLYKVISTTILPDFIPKTNNKKPSIYSCDHWSVFTSTSSRELAFFFFFGTGGGRNGETRRKQINFCTSTRVRHRTTTVVVYGYTS